MTDTPRLIAGGFSQLGVTLMSRIDPSNEPARQPDYRRFCEQTRNHIANHDSSITWLMGELRSLQKRVNQLEAARARAATVGGEND
jgi:hypothetical protein